MEGAETVAAFICEPITSGGGVLVPPENYLKEVRKVCDEHGVLLILDEVVSGFGRTGAMFGHHHYGVTPDIVTLAKGLTSGYQPLGACGVSDRMFANFHDCPRSSQLHWRRIPGRRKCRKFPQNAAIPTPAAAPNCWLYSGETVPRPARGPLPGSPAY